MRTNNENCEHCWHQHEGKLYMVIPDGCVVQECCKCHDLRTIHGEHRGRAYEARA